MRRTAVLISSLVLVVASMVSFSACGERDPKALTDTATDALQARDYKTSMTGFEHALTQMDASHVQYMRASVGRCVALAHVDPVKGKDEFLKLVETQAARMEPADIHLVVSEFVKVGQLALAAEIMAAVKKHFPQSKAILDIGNSVADAAIRTGDSKTRRDLESNGYVGSGK